MTRIILALLLLTNGAYAAELTLNDLPAVLSKLRDCGMVSCGEAKALAIVKDDGTISINYDNRRGIDVYGRGATISLALADLASKLNAMGADSKATVQRLGPMLPTQ